MQCKGHSVVRGIDWFEDDSGFCSTGGEGAYFYNLEKQREQKQRLIDNDTTVKNVQLQCIVNDPNDKYQKALVVGNDKCVR